jgi:8-oxo-dGTP diphosphatase
MPEKPFKLAVRAVITDKQGRCLLIRRSDVCKHFVGQWEWPGGKVDEGETFDVALLREVREETGLEVELLDVVGAIGIEMAEVRLAVLCIETKLLGGTLRLSEEHDDHAWVPMAEVPEWNLTGGLKELAESYVAAKKDRGKNHD